MHDNIVLRGVRVHNLKNISLELPKNKLVVITGLSGSGKSSLAFDTIFSEGQRRYMESVSPYAARLVGVREKPDVDLIEGLSPTIAITQQKSGTNPRSTVGTLTEIYDYVRLLFAKVGEPACSKCREKMMRYSFDGALSLLVDEANRMSQFIVVSVLLVDGVSVKHTLEELANAGFVHVRVNGRVEKLSHLLQVREIEGVQTLEVIFEEAITKDTPRARTHKTLARAFDLGNGTIFLVSARTISELSTVQDSRLLSLNFFCETCRIVRDDLAPQDFSFNAPQGACPSCTGLGVKMMLDPKLLIPNKNLSILQGAILPLVKLFPTQKNQQETLQEISKRMKFSLNDPVATLSPKAMAAVLYGDPFGLFVGVIPFLEQKYKETKSDYLHKELEKYMIKTICPLCKGARLKEDALRVLVAGYSITDIITTDIVSLRSLFVSMQNKSKLAEVKIAHTDQKIISFVVNEIVKRLRDVADIGLGYLTINRSVPTLSGGELQRLRLSKQLSSSLSDIIYVLDEPSVGLHSRDIEKLIVSLKKLQQNGNSIILVEHDPAIIAAAEMIVDIGPRAGEYGGELVFQGTYSGLLKDKRSLTGKYLRGDMKIERSLYSDKKKQDRRLTITGARAHNLKDVTVAIPLGKFVAVTGVSGSGKSTLIVDILSRALRRFFHRSKAEPGEHDTIDGINNVDNVVIIDQSPIGKTPKSNPATYTGVFTLIRDLFVSVPESRIKGYRAGVFSFNKDGRCLHCQGEGLVKIEMHFLNDMYVPCEVCGGTRYNKEALEVFYKGRSIAEVLDMSVTQARDFFNDVPAISHKLKLLVDVGLGYIRLGQAATTLSGGESQRLKLATELAKRSTGNTFYILDEPTTGLHFDDINNLIAVLSRLVDRGNTVLVIEHNLDVIKCSDWVIDLGPEGGADGGMVVAEGTPADISKVARSYTGRYLKELLK